MINPPVYRHSNSLVLNYLELVKQDSNYMSCIVRKALENYFIERECPSFQSCVSSSGRLGRERYFSIITLTKLELLTKLSTYNVGLPSYLIIESPDSILINILKKHVSPLELIKLLDKVNEK